MLTFSAVQDNDKIVGDLTKWLDPLEEVMCSPLGMNMAYAWLAHGLGSGSGSVLVLCGAARTLMRAENPLVAGLY